MDEVLILTGFMGVGKTASGRALAEILGWEFVDLDRAVEQEAGRSVSELFAEAGEEHFRGLEAEALSRALQLRRVVIATGGGVLLREGNRRLLAGRRVRYLYASPEEILRRLRTSSTPRPLLAGPDPEARVRRIYSERASLYEASGRRVDTEGKSPREVAEEIARELAAEAR